MGSPTVGTPVACGRPLALSLYPGGAGSGPIFLRDPDSLVSAISSRVVSKSVAGRIQCRATSVRLSFKTGFVVS
jgi:hypothetical protein